MENSLYDVAFEQRALPIERTIAHGLAHLYFQKMTQEQRQSYNLAAQWDTRTAQPAPGRKSSEYVAEDGEKSPEEDFANNIEFELFDRKTLLNKSRPIHNWIALAFGDSLELGVECAKK